MPHFLHQIIHKLWLVGNIAGRICIKRLFEDYCAYVGKCTMMNQKCKTTEGRCPRMLIHASHTIEENFKGPNFDSYSNKLVKIV